MVCVKFPAQSVDEMYLRKLVEPFGKIIKILMFPSLVSPHIITQSKQTQYSVVQYLNCDGTDTPNPAMTDLDAADRPTLW